MFKKKKLSAGYNSCVVPLDKRKKMSKKNSLQKKNLEMGAVIRNPGNTTENKTGGWRSLRPVWDEKKCTQCMICWVYCPDMAIPQKDGKRQETNFDFCKGCGLCKSVCAFGAITMEKEKK